MIDNPEVQGFENARLTGASAGFVEGHASLGRLRRHPPKASLYCMDRGKELTQRQWQCIDRRALNFSNKEIARQLGLSPATVAMHLRLARERLGTAPNEANGDQPQPNGSEQARSQQERIIASDPGLTWFDALTQAVAAFMLWLTTLAVAVVATVGMIDGVD